MQCARYVPAAQGIGSLRIDFRGFGKSDGDTGAATVGGQIEDAEAAYNWLVAQPWVDPARWACLALAWVAALPS